MHNSGTTQRQLKQLMAQRTQMSPIQLNSLDSKEITLNSTNKICKTQLICKMKHNYLVLGIGIDRFISFAHVEAPHQENWNLCKIYLHAIAMRVKVQELWICLICKSIVAASKYCVVVTWLCTGPGRKTLRGQGPGLGLGKAKGWPPPPPPPGWPGHSYPEIFLKFACCTCPKISQ